MLKVALSGILLFSKATPPHPVSIFSPSIFLNFNLVQGAQEIDCKFCICDRSCDSAEYSIPIDLQDFTFLQDWVTGVEFNKQEEEEL